MRARSSVMVASRSPDKFDDTEPARNFRFLVADARVGWNQLCEFEQKAAGEWIDSIVQCAVVNDLEERGSIAGIDRDHRPEDTTYVIFRQRLVPHTIEARAEDGLGSVVG